MASDQVVRWRATLVYISTSQPISNALRPLLWNSHFSFRRGHWCFLGLGRKNEILWRSFKLIAQDASWDTRIRDMYVTSSWEREPRSLFFFIFWWKRWSRLHSLCSLWRNLEWFTGNLNRKGDWRQVVGRICPRSSEWVSYFSFIHWICVSLIWYRLCRVWYTNLLMEDN